MRRVVANLTAVFLLLGTTTSVFSQNLTRSRDSAMTRARSYRQKSEYRGAANRNRDRLGTFQTNRYRGAMTRTEQLSEIIRSFRRPTGQRETNVPLTHPMRDLLERRNLLSPRSVLATRSVSYLGRNIVTPQPADAPTAPVGGSAGVATAEPAKVSAEPDLDQLFEPAGNRADKYFELGVQSFRKKDYLRAASYFDLVQDIQYDQARPFLAGLLTSYQHQDMNQAYNMLRSGLKRAASADDLRIDRNLFFEDAREFTRAVNDITIWAKSQPNSPAANVMLAYYSWLNGDHATAVDALDTAINVVAIPEEGELFQKFRDLITAQPAPQP